MAACADGVAASLSARTSPGSTTLDRVVRLHSCALLCALCADRAESSVRLCQSTVCKVCDLDSVVVLILQILVKPFQIVQPSLSTHFPFVFVFRSPSPPFLCLFQEISVETKALPCKSSRVQRSPSNAAKPGGSCVFAAKRLLDGIPTASRRELSTGSRRGSSAASRMSARQPL